MSPAIINPPPEILPSQNSVESIPHKPVPDSLKIRIKTGTTTKTTNGKNKIDRKCLKIVRMPYSIYQQFFDAKPLANRGIL